MISFKDTINYDKIINFLYEENDIITKLLIDSYIEYVFVIKNSNSRKKVDKIMGLYVEKEDFYKYVLKNLSIDDVYLPYDIVIRKLNNIYKDYENFKNRNFKSTRWL